MLKPIFIVCCFLWALKLEATSLNNGFADSYSNSQLYSSSAVDTTDGSLKMKQLLSAILNLTPLVKKSFLLFLHYIL